jgi:hypothetical protein
MHDSRPTGCCDAHSMSEAGHMQPTKHCGIVLTLGRMM